MHLNNSDQSSSLDKTLGIIFAALITFIVGYTASRVFLSGNSSADSTIELNVIPHEGTLWSDFGR